MYRADFTEDTWAAIREAIDKWLAWYRDGPKSCYSDVDADYVYRVLRDGHINVVLVGGYLLVYDVGTPWYSPDLVMLEELTVFRVDPKPASFRVIPQALLQIAAGIPNCTRVVVGTSYVRDHRLRRVYERYGFKVEAEALYRSI